METMQKTKHDENEIKGETRQNCVKKTIMRQNKVEGKTIEK